MAAGKPCDIASLSLPPLRADRDGRDARERPYSSLARCRAVGHQGERNMTDLMIRAALQDDLEILCDFLAICAATSRIPPRQGPSRVSPRISSAGAAPVISGSSRSRIGTVIGPPRRDDARPMITRSLSRVTGRPGYRSGSDPAPAARDQRKAAARVDRQVPVSAGSASVSACAAKTLPAASTSAWGLGRHRARLSRTAPGRFVGMFGTK